MASRAADFVVHLVYRCSVQRISVLWRYRVGLHSGLSIDFISQNSLDVTLLSGFQEAFRYVVYKLLDKTSAGLEELAGDSLVTHNKPVLAYVSGLGFGLISGVS